MSKNLTITSPYGMRYHPIKTDANGKPLYHFHNGVDVTDGLSDPLVLRKFPKKGKKSYDQYNGNRFIGTYTDAVGNRVQIIVCHLDKVTDEKHKSGGYIIGPMGSTGRSTGPHYHISMKVNGKYVDPTSYLSQLFLLKGEDK